MKRAHILVDGGIGWALSAGLAQEGFQVADAGVHLALLAVLDPGRLAATPFVEGGLEVWRARCDAVLLAARQAIETARANLAVEGGVIAVLVPAEGMTGAAGLTAYLAAVEGVRALVKSLGQAWAADSVRINCIAVEAHVLHHDPNALRRVAIPLAAQLLSPGHPLSGTTLVAGGGVMAP